MLRAGCIRERSVDADCLPEQAPLPQRSIISLRREYLEAMETLLPLLQLELRIFDPDLSGLGFNAPARIDVLKAFLRRSRNTRIYIAVHDTDYIVRCAPRFMTLLGAFSASMFIHKTEAEAACLQDCFILCDTAHFVRRAVAAHPRGAVYLHHPGEARIMRERFDEIWQSSYPAVSPTQAGL
jgi:hypothetical protein